MVPPILSSHRALLVSLLLMLVSWSFLPRAEGAFDDWWIHAALEGKPSLGAMSAREFFTFADGDPAHLGREAGPMPWFADPSLKLALWRPLSVLTHRFDHATFGFISLGASVHSLLWAILLLLGTFRLFRRTLTPGVAGVASVVFALASSHAEPLVWLAARNALVAAAFGVWSIYFYLSGRDHERMRDRVLALVLFVLALLSGEGALGVVPYLVSYELFARREHMSRRLLALMPFVTAALVWLLAYVAQGFGTRGSGYYLNPLTEPLRFLVELPWRFFTLVGGAVLGSPTILWFVRPELRLALVLFGIVGLSLLLFACLPSLRRAAREERSALTWLFVGALLSLIPPSAGMLGARSLVLPSLGVSAWVAYGLCSGARLESRVGRAAQRTAIVLLALVHLVVAPVAWFITGKTYADAFAAEKQAIANSELQNLEGKRVFVLFSPDPAFSLYLPSRLLVSGAGFVSWSPLSLAPVAHRVTRVSGDGFELEQSTPPPPSFEQAFRGPERPQRVGEHVDLGFMQATVREVEGTWRKRVAFRFERDVDDPSLVFLAWQNGALRQVALPKRGESLVIPFEKGPWTF